MRCPACHAALIVVEREAIEVDWCQACGGLWFDEGELELLAEKAGRDLAQKLIDSPEGRSAKGKRRCPRCPKRMQSVQVEVGSGERTTVDRCPRHGLWLDRGELGQLLRSAAATSSSGADLVLEFLGETFENTEASVS